MSETKKDSTSGVEADGANNGASGLSRAVFASLSAMPIFAVAAFGAVDVWALGALTVFAAALAFLWLAEAWRKREFRFNASVLLLPLLGLIAVGSVQLLPVRPLDVSPELLSIPAVSSISLAPYATRLAVVQLVVYFVFFAACLTFINSDKRMRIVVSTLIVVGAVAAFSGVLQRLGNLDAIYGLRPFNQASPFASYFNQHHFAALMEMIVGIALGLLGSGGAVKKNKLVFLVFAVLIMGIAVVFTSSRGALVSLVAVVGFIVVANLAQKNNQTDGAGFPRKLALLGGGLALLLVLFGAVLLLGGGDSLARGIGLQNPDDFTNGRIHFWQTTWRIFLDYPLLGAGLDSFAYVFTRYDTWNGTFRLEQAHNDYLQILADAGIVGFACVAWFIFLLYRGGWRTVRRSSDAFRRATAIGALAGASGILLHSFFDFPLRTPANALVFLILAALTTVSIDAPKARRRRRKPAPNSPA